MTRSRKPFLLGLTIAMIAGVAARAEAAIFTIADGDVTGLIAAIATANANGEADTIELAASGVYSLSAADNGINGLPVVTGALTINGHGASIFRALAAPPFRIMEIRPPATVVLNGLTISNGDSGGRNTYTSLGGNIAVLNAPGDGNLVATDALVAATVLTLDDGSIVAGGVAGLGGGILVEPDAVLVTIRNSFIVGNLAAKGAGINLLNDAQLVVEAGTYIGSNSAVGLLTGIGRGAVGGGIASAGQGTITIRDSAVSGNEAAPGQLGESGYGGGIADEGGATITIERCEMIGNVNRFGIENQGGAIQDDGGATITIVNTTFSNNLALTGSALSGAAAGTWTLRNVTIADNFAYGAGGGIHLASGTMTLANTIVAGNTGTSAPDCNGTLTSLGHNIVGDDSGCVVTPTTGDQIDVDPLLGPFTDNGGSTTTQALLFGSPAIDAGDPAGCKDGVGVTLTTDQRGFPRPVGAACDIGAFERGLVLEDCDNCLDDDDNQLVDRADPACLEYVDGHQAGLGDVKRGKALGKCAQALAKAGTKLAASETKRLHKCLQTAFGCVQQKPGDAKCQAKAQKACGLATSRRPQDLAKYGAAVRAKCAPPALTAGELLGPAGLGFEHEAPLCLRFGISSLTAIDDVVSCTAALHACRAQEMVAMQLPRAAELLAFGGSSAASFACLDAGADGDQAGAGDPKREGKRAAKCAKGVTKAGAKFASGKTKLVQKCVLGVSKCLQEKSADAKCLPKARATCAKQIAKLGGPKGLEAKLAGAVVKACDDPGLGLAATLTASGIGFGVRAAECQSLGVAGLDVVAHVGACLTRQHECRVEQLLETELPRVRELLAAGGVVLP